MRIVYLAATTEMGPASRYRIYQYQRYFQSAGLELQILPALGDAWLQSEFYGRSRRQLTRLAAGGIGLARRLAQLKSLESADLVVLERELFPKLPGFLENYLLKRAGPYGVEFDDAIYLSPGRKEKYPQLLRNAAFVIAGNEHLATWARQHQANTHIVPTCVPTEKYNPKTSYALGSLAEVGWVGLSSNLPYVAEITPWLKDGLANHQARLHILSGQPGELEIPTLFTPWSEAIEAPIIENFDVGIMPLPETDFAAGKCGLKILQYMAAGVPVIASAVGVNTSIIQNGINGLLAHTPQEWATSLDLLLGDETLRASMGRAGRQTVEQDYSADTWGPKLVQLYRTFMR